MGPRASGARSLHVEKFAVSAAILRTSEPLVSLTLCEARLQADRRWPWVVLVPRRAGAKEVEHLSATDRAVLMEEAMLAGAAVRAIGSALGRPVEKLNIAALGNVTPQLHLHVVGRRADDAAWPGPVWGVGEALAYDAIALERAREAAIHVLESAALRASS
jgi:diadenosine tetraphosphate (Ap4A) HIT family hydrolase